MSFFYGPMKLTYVRIESELEPVEAQDENDGGYLWRDRKVEAELDLNPGDYTITITREDIEDA